VITAIDTKILVDIFEPDPVFGVASKEALQRCLREGSVIACEVVWAEVITAYSHKRNEAVEALRRIGIEYSAMTLEACLGAATCWSAFRRKNKVRERIVADFLVGGHALVKSERLLTRDRGFYRTYFKPLKVESPRC
jgi:predicted nucleic acid-binding protein